MCLKSKRILDLPPEPTHNQYQELPVCTHLTRTGGFQPSRSVQAHSHAATALDVHPHKPVVATASDDHTWKLWTISRYVHVGCPGHNDPHGVLVSLLASLIFNLIHCQAFL